MNPLALCVAALAVCSLGLIFSIGVPAALGRALGFVCLGIAGAIGAAAATAQLLTGATLTAGSPQLHAAIRLDSAAAFFIAVIGAVAIIVAIYGLGARNADEQRSGRTASAGACIILLASLLACLANDILLFIFAWELLALAFFWTIGYAGIDPQAPKAAYVTLLVTHAAGALMVGVLLFLAHRAGSFAPDSVTAAAASLSPIALGAVLVLLLAGFGAKFGMMPLQAWMPYGYRAAPSVVAALMAGGAINVGFYGLFRFVLAIPVVPVWFAIVAVGVGAVSAFFGIAWAASQNDIRPLAAFSSIENAGVILVALGVALAGRATGSPTMVGLGIAAAALQIVAHAAAKTTLFLTCSTLGDRADFSLTQLGGLAKSMPVTLVSTTIASLSLAALPPLAGFAGEWLVLEALMQAFRTQRISLEVALALAAALVGVAAGVAVVAFTKYLGIGMLGAPRSPQAAGATETPSWCKRIAMSLGALCVVAAGLFSPQIIGLAAPMIDGISGSAAAQGVAPATVLLQPAFAKFASASPLGLCCLIAGFTFLFWLLARLIPRPQARTVEAWTSGQAYRPWTQYTGTGYVNATRAILDVGLRTEREIETGTFATPTTYRSTIRPFFDVPAFRRIAGLFLRVADVVRSTQSGVIAAYLSYILVFTIVLLLLYPSIRRW